MSTTAKKQTETPVSVIENNSKDFSTENAAVCPNQNNETLDKANALIHSMYGNMFQELSKV